MGGTFNGQILVEKLAKLNSSQQSIETLSHWCIFHRKKAKEVVETWARQFHCAPREQRLSFLYLANDILQNSKRKGPEFVDEFWKVLPDALTDITHNGDELGRNSARRLVDIWDDRKVFGSRAQTLKEGLSGINLENRNKEGKITSFKPKQSIGSTLEKIISGYEAVYDRSKNEEALLIKCKEAIGCVDKVKNDIGGDYSSVQLNVSSVVEELQGQKGTLGECIEQLGIAESSRTCLVSHLKEALRQQEHELEQVRKQLQAAQSQFEQAGNVCQRLLHDNNNVTAQRPTECSTFSDLSSSFTVENPSTSVDKEQSAPVMYTRQIQSLPNNTAAEEDHRKSAAAAVVAKLTASSSSAQMLTYVFSSLASEGVTTSKQISESSDDFPSEKRPRLESSQSLYTPLPPQPQEPPPPPPPFPHPDSFQQPQPPPPPPSSSPSPPPPTPTPTNNYMQTAGSMASAPYSYGLSPRRPPPLPGYPLPGSSLTGMPPYPSPPSPYQNFQGSGSGFYSGPPLPSTPPISRQ